MPALSPRLLGRLPGDKVHHGSEELRLSARYERVSCNLELLSDVVGSLGDEADRLEGADGRLRGELAEPGHAPAGEDVPQALALADVSLERVEPLDAVSLVCQVGLLLDLETNGLEGAASGCNVSHLRDTVSDLDAVGDSAMLWVGSIVDVGHAPFVDAEDSSWLEDFEDLAVHTFPVRSVARSLNSVHCIEGVRTELFCELHEVALDKGDLVLQSGLLCVPLCARNLILVVVETDDLDSGKASDLTSWSTDTAADIEDSHLWLESHGVGKVVLMASECLLESFSGVVSGEVEVLSPAVFVEVCSSVVVA